MATTTETNSMARETMIHRSVHEGLLRLMPPTYGLVQMLRMLVTFMLLAAVYVHLLNEVKSLGATYGLVQMLRMLAIAHVLRFVQAITFSIPVTYLKENVLLFYDLPITAAISVFYTVSRIFPSPPVVVLVLSLYLLFCVILTTPRRIEVEQDTSPTQDSSSNTDHQLDHQGNDDDDSFESLIFYLSLIISEALEAVEPTHVQVTDHFASILLTVICVDLMVEVEHLKGTYKLFSMVFVLASRHIPYFLGLSKNNVPPGSYLRRALVSCDIPITAFMGLSYDKLCPPKSKIMSDAVGMEALLVILMYTKKKLEQDISPTQGSSSNIESVHQQRTDAELISAHGASNRIEDAADANSISDTNNPSRWIIHKDRIIGSGGFGDVFVAENRETRRLAAVKVLKDNKISDDDYVKSLQEI